MDAAVLQFNLSSQPAAGGLPASMTADEAAALGLSPGADLFAALLAQQLGPESIGQGLQQTPVVQVADKDALQPQIVPLDPMLQAALAAQAVVPLAGAIRPETAVHEAEASVPDPAATVVPLTAPVVSRQDSFQAATAGASRPSIAADAVVVEQGRERQPVAAAAAGFAVADTSDRPVREPDFAAMVAQAANEGVSAAATTAVNLPVQSTLQVQAGPTQPTYVIPQSVGHSAWGGSLGDRVVWMVNQQQQGVELHLNPPALGPLEVRLSMNDGQANLSFSTQHLPVREAIESATPRLREMLGESGITLGSVSVNVGSFTQQQPGQSEYASNDRGSWSVAQPATDFSTSLMTTPIARATGGRGMVDIFA